MQVLLVVLIPLSLIPGRASLMVWNDAERLTESRRSHFSAGNSSSGATYCTPAEYGRREGVRKGEEGRER